MTEVDGSLLKYFEKDDAFLVFGGKANTLNPVQMVVTAALGKIGKAAIEPKADPTNLPFAYIAESLARMPNNHPAGTRIVSAQIRLDVKSTYSEDLSPPNATRQSIC